METPGREPNPGRPLASPSSPAADAGAATDVIHQVPDDQPAAGHAITSDRPGLLIIRAWIEEGSSEPLRAQVRVADDVSAGFDRVLTLSRADAVCATVGEWLEDLVSKASRLS